MDVQTNQGVCRSLIVFAVSVKVKLKALERSGASLRWLPGQMSQSVASWDAVGITLRRLKSGHIVTYPARSQAMTAWMEKSRRREHSCSPLFQNHELCRYSCSGGSKLTEVDSPRDPGAVGVSQVPRLGMKSLCLNCVRESPYELPPDIIDA